MNYGDMYKKAQARSEGIPASLADRTKIDTAALAKAESIELAGAIVWTHKPVIDADGQIVMTKKGKAASTVLTWVPLIVTFRGKGPEAVVWVTKSRKMAYMQPEDAEVHSGTDMWEVVSEPLEGTVVLDQEDVKYANGKEYPQAFLRPADQRAIILKPLPQTPSFSRTIIYPSYHCHIAV